MTQSLKIPLFPLGVVILPDMLLPLHIFEARYKQMIAECLEADRPFGIVLFDGQSIRKVGCMARITDVLKRYGDGRMDIMTRGGERFVVQALIEERAYMEARVVFFDDAAEPSEENLDALVETALNLLKESGQTHIGSTPLEHSSNFDPKQLAYVIAALEGFTPVDRQGFLEMRSPSERLKKCIQTLSRIMTRQRLTQEILGLIEGNGSPPKSVLSKLKTS